MKPTNDPFPPVREFWCLRDERGTFYAYSNNASGVRCSEDTKHARKYGTRKGARAAQSNIERTYGKQTKPVRFAMQAKEAA